MRRLTEKEEPVMQVLWQLGRAFVKEIVAELPEPKPPVTTVSSIVRKLESEGFVGHESFGKTYRYFPRVSKSDYRKSYFQEVLDNYFGGSPEKVLSFFVQEEKLDPDEINELLDRIRRKEEGDQTPPS